MTYNVFGGTLSLTQSINQPVATQDVRHQFTTAPIFLWLYFHSGPSREFYSILYTPICSWGCTEIVFRAQN